MSQTTETIQYRRPAPGGPVHAVAPGSAAAICGARPPAWSEHAQPRPDCPTCRQRLGLKPVRLDIAPISGGSPEADLEAGDVVGEQPTTWTILPPAPGVCKECGTEHPAEHPHDRDSMLYQYRFNALHGRWPTWADAMAHCPDAIRELWRKGLVEHYQKRGRAIPPELREPPCR